MDDVHSRHPFLDLPPELFGLICEHAGAKSVQALRLTSKHISQNAWHPYARLFETVKVMFFHKSLELLENMAAHKQLRLYVRHVIFGTERLEQYELPILKAISGGPGYRWQLDQRARMIKVYDPNLESNWAALKEEDRTWHSNNNISSLLVEVLLRFPNLRTIAVEDRREAPIVISPRSNPEYQKCLGQSYIESKVPGLRLEWRGTHFHPSPRSRDTWEQVILNKARTQPHRERQEVFYTIFEVLRQLKQSERDVQLRIVLREMVDLTQFPDPNLTNLILDNYLPFNIEDRFTMSVLKQHLTHFEMHDHRDFDMQNPFTSRSILKTLQECPITTLKLKTSSLTWWTRISQHMETNDPHLPPLDLKFPMLQHLEISPVESVPGDPEESKTTGEIDKADLRALLEMNRAHLRSLYLDNIVFLDFCDWQEILQVILDMPELNTLGLCGLRTRKAKPTEKMEDDERECDEEGQAIFVVDEIHEWEIVEESERNEHRVDESTDTRSNEDGNAEGENRDTESDYFDDDHDSYEEEEEEEEDPEQFRYKYRRTLWKGNAEIKANINALCEQYKILQGTDESHMIRFENGDLITWEDFICRDIPPGWLPERRLRY